MNKSLLSLLALSASLFVSAQGIGDKPVESRLFVQDPAFNESFTIAETPRMSRVATVDDLIMEPEGRLELYSMKGIGIASIFGGLQEALMQGATDIVWGEDNKVYLHNPLGGFTYGYVEGQLSEDGTKITVQLPQTIAAVNYSTPEGVDQYPMKLSVMKKISSYEEDVEVGPEYIALPDEENVVVYEINEAGVITQVSPYQENFVPDEENYLLYPEEMLTVYIEAPAYVIYGGDLDYIVKYWYGYCNLNQTFTPLPDDFIVYEIPEGLEFEHKWQITSLSAWNEIVDGVIYGDAIYLKNLTYMMPDAVIVGEIEGDKVRFRDKQYLGINYNTNRFVTFRGAYTYPGEPDWQGNPTILFGLTNEDVIMDFDRETLTMSLNEDTKGFIYNSLIETVFYYCAFNRPNIHYQVPEDLEAAPQNPIITGWYDYSEWYDHPYFQGIFDFPEFNVKGNIIDYNDLYYRFYVDGEPFIFSEDDGYGVGEDAEWLCSTFVDSNYKIMGYGDAVYIEVDQDGIEEIGIQSAYKAPNGETYLSDLVSMYVGTTGISSALNESAVCTEYFDLQGRKVVNPASGSLLLEVSTYANGKVATRKVVK